MHGFFPSSSMRSSRPLGSGLAALARRRQRVAGDFTLVRPPELAELEPDPLAPNGERVTRVIGLDLGQSPDPSAAAVVETRSAPPEFCGPRLPPDLREVLALRVWENCNYPALIDDVLAARPHVIVFDFGGVGRAWSQFLDQRIMELNWRPRVVRLQTVSSNAQARVHDYGRRHVQCNVPKVDIVTSLILAQQRHQLQFLMPERDPGLQRLLREMRDFRRLYADTRRGPLEKFEHRGKNHHGDLCLSLGLGLWWIGRMRRELAVY